MTSPCRRALWGRALRDPAVHRRALAVAVPVGLLQVVINQGDDWVRMAVDSVVVLKTLVTPLVAFVVALLSAAGSRVDSSRVDAVREQENQ